MSEIPEDIMEKAERIFSEIGNWDRIDHAADIEVIARAIMEERERCLQLVLSESATVAEHNGDSEVFYPLAAAIRSPIQNEEK